MSRKRPPRLLFRLRRLLGQWRIRLSVDDLASCSGGAAEPPEERAQEHDDRGMENRLRHRAFDPPGVESGAGIRRARRG